MGAVTELVNKQAVADAFSRAAVSYESAAQLQRDVGEHLISMVAETHQAAGLSLLDAGCGTGYFSRRWRDMGKQVTALDLSQGHDRYGPRAGFRPPLSAG